MSVNAQVVKMIDSNVLPCWYCGEMPVMIRDEFGFSCLHICLSHRMCGSLNYATHEMAVEEWNSLNREEQS